jgi:hypothetical protein
MRTATPLLDAGRRGLGWTLGILLLILAACVLQNPDQNLRHRWWAGFGPVLPHEKFPADCKLCHTGDNWQELTPSFRFDHAKETGVPLRGAHAQAQCLRCHNDRGPVATFQARGCGGCHEDVHTGKLGPLCDSCHGEVTWQPVGQIERHDRTRFPLTGAHRSVSCNRCHVGARVGNFVPTDTECVSCHRNDLLQTINPPHIPLGWVDRCDRCHMPTKWEQGQLR